MFSTIVVGTDGSPDANQALRATAKLAKLAPGAKIHVVAGFRPIPPAELRATSDSLPDEFKPLVHGSMQVDSTIEAARSIMKAANIEADYHEVSDRPADAILNTIEKYAADLVVVGSRGEGAAKRLIHGSVSTSVLHHAPCAVLVVRADR